jgi:AcrR family transcriptional regulator
VNRDRPSSTAAARTYNNAFREEQAQKTRERILETAIALLRSGSSEALSVPRIAQEAGISAATIYRHFPDREALFDGVDAFMGEKLGRPPLPESLEDLIEGAPALFRYYDGAKELMRVIQSTPVLREQNASRRKGRDERLGTVARELTQGLEPRRANAIHALLRTLHGFDTYESMHTRFGVGPDEASDVVAWAARALVRELEKERKGGRAPAGTMNAKRTTKAQSAGGAGKRREGR